jgi:hypothetical protein
VHEAHEDFLTQWKDATSNSSIYWQAKQTTPTCAPAGIAQIGVLGDIKPRSL